MSVCPVTRCLEQSIFTYLGQRAGQSTQRAVREQPEHYNQNHTVGASKYCVLLVLNYSF